MKSESDTSMGGNFGVFPSTRWTAILSAKDSGEPAYQENLQYLIRLYWKPVYKYIRIGWSKNNEDAKDITQDFFASLISRESLRDVSPDKGRFRSFIKAALRNFLMQEKRDANRLKRGGGKHIMQFDFSEVEPVAPQSATPDDEFDREWAGAIIESALTRLRERLTNDGKQVYFEIFQRFYFGKEIGLSYDVMADEFKISKFDVGNYLKAARTKFRDITLELIREYVTDDDERDKEFDELFGSMM